MELNDPGHSSICSDSIDAEIRGVGQESTETHMFGGQSGDASPESLPLRAGPARSDSRGKDERRCSKLQDRQKADHQLISMLFSNSFH